MVYVDNIEITGVIPYFVLRALHLERHLFGAFDEPQAFRFNLEQFPVYIIYCYWNKNRASIKQNAYKLKRTKVPLHCQIEQPSELHVHLLSHQDIHSSQ